MNLERAKSFISIFQQSVEDHVDGIETVQAFLDGIEDMDAKTRRTVDDIFTVLSGRTLDELLHDVDAGREARLPLGRGRGRVLMAKWDRMLAASNSRTWEQRSAASKKHRPVRCPVCGHTGRPSGMALWHFGRCRMKSIRAAARRAQSSEEAVSIHG
jgi:hypothetical protein